MTAFSPLPLMNLHFFSNAFDFEARFAPCRAAELFTFGKAGRALFFDRHRGNDARY